MIFIGIDLSVFAFKAVAIKTTGRSFTVLDTHFFSFPSSADKEKRDLLIVGHLKTLKDLYKNQEVKYIFCFPQNEISTCRLTFPFKERYKITKSLPFEMEDQSLFDYKKLISDFKIIKSTENKTDILVFSLFREKILNLLHQMESVGIEPFIFTCSASAFANLFEEKREARFLSKKQDTPEKTSQDTTSSSATQKTPCEIYLKLGHAYSVAFVFNNNCLHNVYHFEWGVSYCIKRIALKYEISFSAAQDQFCEKAFVLTSKRGYTGSQIAFSGLIQEEFEHLIHKVNLLFLQLDGEINWQCKKIIICGGGAQVRNLQAFLSLKWNIPVVRAEQAISFASWNFRNNEQHQNNFITALGAAMEGLKGIRRPAINFLREEFAVKFNLSGLLSTRGRQLLVTGGVCFLLFFCYTYIRDRQSQKLSTHIHQVFEKNARRIMQFRRGLVTSSKVSSFLNKKKHLIKNTQLTSVLSGIPSALDSMKDISIVIRKKPSWNLKIKTLVVKNKNIQISGAISNSYLKKLENNLQVVAQKGTFKSLPLSDRPDNLTTQKEKNKSSAVVSFAYSFIRREGGGDEERPEIKKRGG